MVQCRNLGMTTNVAQMNHALMDMTKNVGEDDVAVNSMQKEAKQMQEVVTVVIKDMTMLGQAASHNLKMCRDIMSSFRHMGINCDSFAHLVQDKSAVLEGSLDKKQAFTPDCDPTALTGFVKTEPMVTEQLESNILAMDGTCGQSSADYPTLTGISAAAMPKLSWAAGRSLPPPAGKKSFLDIQKEEMNTKGNL